MSIKLNIKCVQLNLIANLLIYICIRNWVRNRCILWFRAIGIMRRKTVDNRKLFRDEMNKFSMKRWKEWKSYLFHVSIYLFESNGIKNHGICSMHNFTTFFLYLCINFLFFFSFLSLGLLFAIFSDFFFFCIRLIVYYMHTGPLFIWNSYEMEFHLNIFVVVLFNSLNVFCQPSVHSILLFTLDSCSAFCAFFLPALFLFNIQHVFYTYLFDLFFFFLFFRNNPCSVCLVYFKFYSVTAFLLSSSCFRIQKRAIIELKLRHALLPVNLKAGTRNSFFLSCFHFV